MKILDLQAARRLMPGKAENKNVDGGLFEYTLTGRISIYFESENEGIPVKWENVEEQPRYTMSAARLIPAKPPYSFYKLEREHIREIERLKTSYKSITIDRAYIYDKEDSCQYYFRKGEHVGVGMIRFS